MKTKVLFTMLVSAAMILTAPLVGLGAPGGVQGPPGGGGGAGDAAGLLYGDLYVIERDGAGVPITRPVTYEDSETQDNVTVQCQQPLADNCALLPLWGECGLSTLPECATYDPAYDPCAVYGTPTDNTYADQLQTVSFGRESVSRSPASVIDKSYAEALKAVNLALPNQCTKSDDTQDARAIKLDPAGRITLCIPQEDTDIYAWKTIDAPLENLGLYRAVMTDGCFEPIVEQVVGTGGETIDVTTELSDEAKGYLTASELPHLRCDDSPPDPKADMLSAAVFIAAGADKTSPINLDEIINVNTYLGVNTYTPPTRGKDRSLDVTYYFPFTDNVTPGPGDWFGYTNGVDACDPRNPDTTVSLLTTTDSGVLFRPLSVSVFRSRHMVDLDSVAITVCRDGLPLQENDLDVVCDNAGSDPVYGGPDEEGILGCGGANWFTQAAEDARKTIWYLHNWRVPVVDY